MKTNIIVLIIATTISIAQSFGQSAKLIVYRPGSAYGSLAKYKVNVDNREVATLKSKSMYQMDLTPGHHLVSAKQMRRSVNIEAEAGHTYVVKYGTPLHILGARPKLKMISYADAQKDKRFKRVNGMKMSM